MRNDSTATDKGQYIADLLRATKVNPTHLLELEGPEGSFFITGADLYRDISNYINATTTIQGLVDSVQELHAITQGLRDRIEALERK